MKFLHELVEILTKDRRVASIQTGDWKEHSHRFQLQGDDGKYFTAVVKVRPFASIGGEIHYEWFVQHGLSKHPRRGGKLKFDKEHYWSSSVGTKSPSGHYLSAEAALQPAVKELLGVEKP